MFSHFKSKRRSNVWQDFYELTIEKDGTPKLKLTDHPAQLFSSKRHYSTWLNPHGRSIAAIIPEEKKYIEAREGLLKVVSDNTNALYEGVVSFGTPYHPGQMLESGWHPRSFVPASTEVTEDMIFSELSNRVGTNQSSLYLSSSVDPIQAQRFAPAFKKTVGEEKIADEIESLVQQTLKDKTHLQKIGRELYKQRLVYLPRMPDLSDYEYIGEVYYKKHFLAYEKEQNSGYLVWAKVRGVDIQKLGVYTGERKRYADEKEIAVPYGTGGENILAFCSIKGTYMNGVNRLLVPKLYIRKYLLDSRQYKAELLKMIEDFILVQRKSALNLNKKNSQELRASLSSTSKMVFVFRKEMALLESIESEDFYKSLVKQKMLLDLLRVKPSDLSSSKPITQKKPIVRPELSQTPMVIEEVTPLPKALHRSRFFPTYPAQKPAFRKIFPSISRVTKK